MSCLTPWVRAAAVFLLALPGVSSAWWNEDWAFRKEVTVNTSATGADVKEALVDFPVLVRLHTGNFSFLDAKEDGSDLRFVAADDKTLLAHHVELWDPANELALIWVRVPRIDGGSTAGRFWLYSGNPKAQPDDNAKNTYDAATLLVMHFAAGQAFLADASGRQTQITQSGVTAQSQGPIDGASAYGGSGSVKVAASPALRIGAQSGATLSAWVRITAPQSAATLLALHEGNNLVSLSIAGSKLTARAGAAQVQSAVDLAAGAWHHVAATFAAGKVSLYVDGNAAGEVAATVPELAGELAIGAGLSGDLDEVEVAGAARSAGWIKASWASQSADAKLLSFGQDQQAGVSGHSYFRILLAAVTLDGWVVIGILLLMMVLSFGVMIGKALFVSRSDRANRVFLDSFQKNPDAMLDPGHSLRTTPQLESSSLFRLYRTGLSELSHRFDLYQKSGHPNSLSPQALGSIKASLDAGMVREQARLNSQMVLLTIAISGGPFLGLLGTVVGVMITFAAIAAVGDVNVNSIAPGIAAALVATVAGLGVAIPALFGYNYLASRMKNISNDMTVFADELISRMAEKYAP